MYIHLFKQRKSLVGKLYLYFVWTICSLYLNIDTIQPFKSYLILKKGNKTETNKGLYKRSENRLIKLDIKPENIDYSDLESDDNQ